MNLTKTKIIQFSSSGARIKESIPVRMGNKPIGLTSTKCLGITLDPS